VEWIGRAFELLADVAELSPGQVAFGIIILLLLLSIYLLFGKSLIESRRERREQRAKQVEDIKCAIKSTYDCMDFCFSRVRSYTYKHGKIDRNSDDPFEAYRTYTNRVNASYLDLPVDLRKLHYRMSKKLITIIGTVLYFAEDVKDVQAEERASGIAREIADDEAGILAEEIAHKSRRYLYGRCVRLIPSVTKL